MIIITIITMAINGVFVFIHIDKEKGKYILLQDLTSRYRKMVSCQCTSKALIRLLDIQI